MIGRGWQCWMPTSPTAFPRLHASTLASMALLATNDKSALAGSKVFPLNGHLPCTTLCLSSLLILPRVSEQCHLK